MILKCSNCGNETLVVGTKSLFDSLGDLRGYLIIEGGICYCGREKQEREDSQ